MKNLVIVESPAKTKKIGAFLGDEYVVLSSKGHIRDLPKSSLGVDTEKNYEPEYVISKERDDIVKELKKAAKNSEAIYLAPDLDREGEAIAWHLGYILNNDKPLKESAGKDNFEVADKIKNKEGKNPKVYRVVFNSITKEEVQKAFLSPRKLNYDLIDAQQARRVLDRLVGYKLSPLLWEKIRYGLSAGRVQSVAVRFVVEREREIKNFAQNPYFEIEGDFYLNKKDKLYAKLIKIGGKNIYIKKKYQLFAGEYTTSMTSIESEKEAVKHQKKINSENFKVSKVDVKQTQSHPSAPFTTSTLQQSSSSTLGYAPNRTMQLAQKLYEGGFITYMRTDSVNITETEIQKIRKNIKGKYGDNYLSTEIKRYAVAKEAKTQEAHEAIRPTDITKLSDELPKSLTEQHKKLYDLIWRRTMATQMSPAIYENTKVIIENEGDPKYTFESKGVRQIFDGFTKVYHSNRKDDLLPEVKDQSPIIEQVINIIPNQITPPPRYNESSLVKALESFGIGRPSTYASIVGTIQSRGYVIKKEKNLIPTDNGYVVNDLLVNHFPNIVDVKFTAGMEKSLDEVAIGEKDWRKLIGDFYKPFEKQVIVKKKEIKKEDLVVMEQTTTECPECHEGHLQIKLGKFGKFYSCDRYPECKYAQPIEDENMSDEEKAEQEKMGSEIKDKKCPDCGGELKIKQGRYGKFIACENYPKCKYTQQIQNKIGMKCPKCGKEHDGEVIVKKTKKGRLFYGCNRYPDCDFASWKKPDPIVAG